MTDPNPLYADACPRCLAGPTAPTNGITARGSLTAAYRCRACRHIWTCTWAVVPGRVLPPPPALEEAA
ncbi:hypothetical protein [Streptomyces reniochalinae]|uniref:Uncharacterized protein n=1 Tax=Streptomyces reniochalinae TaxID=2250578 RepID=A0A367EVS7_9ACTN|nr:hypothetical protein [Streptomyces reniochalinae]RCG21789.1 hypothetical protein DQ392_08760 [Streptomyces reniochalinae]